MSKDRGNTEVSTNESVPLNHARHGIPACNQGPCFFECFS